MFGFPGKHAVQDLDRLFVSLQLFQGPHLRAWQPEGVWEASDCDLGNAERLFVFFSLEEDL